MQRHVRNRGTNGLSADMTQGSVHDPQQSFVSPLLSAAAPVPAVTDQDLAGVTLRQERGPERVRTRNGPSPSVGSGKLRLTQSSGEAGDGRGPVPIRKKPRRNGARNKGGLHHRYVGKRFAETGPISFANAARLATVHRGAAIRTLPEVTVEYFSISVSQYLSISVSAY
jgi:hypothetical protein